MRVQPKPIIGVGAYLLYVVIITGLNLIFGPEYDEIADSTENILSGVVLPIGAGVVGIVVLTTWLGWWGPALRDRKRAPAWTIIAPLVMLMAIVGDLIATDFGAFEMSYLLVLAVGMLLVGLGEELTTRGVLLVAMRGRSKEWVAWLVSTLLFGLMHSLNYFFGQDLGLTVQQVLATMLFGTGFYILRRVTGSLIWAMLLHAAWDFSIFANGQAGEISSLTTLAQLLLYLAIPLCLVWAIRKADESPSRVFARA